MNFNLSMGMRRGGKAPEARQKAARGETVGKQTPKIPSFGGSGRKSVLHYFFRPIQGLICFKPNTRSLAVGCYRLLLRSAVLPVITAVVLCSMRTFSQSSNALSDAEKEGQELARSLAGSTVTGNSTNTGTLKIRDSKGQSVTIPVQFEVSLAETGWEANYRTEITRTNGDLTFGRTYFDWLTVIHSHDQLNRYRVPYVNAPSMETNEFFYLKPNEIMVPFARSDFWIVDLGLEFFHWPSQKVIKKEFSRGRGCMVLESVNPDPANGYSKVDSWIDEETDGIVHAEAFDSKGKLLKVFDPKSFKKVNGQWQLEGMEIRNVQTGSRTRIEFDFK